MVNLKADTSTRELRMSRVLHAPVDLVWEVWTDPEHVKNWWGPNGFTTDIHRMELNVNGEWLLTMHGPDGKNFPNRSIFKEIIPNQKIVFQHFNPNFITTVVFEAKGNETSLDWHMMFETKELFETVVKTFKADVGLKQNVEKLEEYLAQKLNSMNQKLLFDFVVNKETKTVNIVREFNASLDLVWDAFTKAEIIDQWIAPKPFAAKTKYQNFKVGGKRFYAMVSPDGAERWSIQEYTSITPKTNFKMHSAFADKDETPELPGSEWDHTFSEYNGKTKVNIRIYNESLERMEKILEGFTQGMKMSLLNLENLLIELSKK